MSARKGEKPPWIRPRGDAVTVIQTNNLASVDVNALAHGDVIYITKTHRWYFKEGTKNILQPTNNVWYELYGLIIIADIIMGIEDPKEFFSDIVIEIIKNTELPTFDISIPKKHPALANIRTPKSDKNVVLKSGINVILRCTRHVANPYYALDVPHTNVYILYDNDTPDEYFEPVEN